MHVDIAAFETRVLGSAELADYDAHLKRLDHASRRSRFAAVVDDISIDTHCLRLASEGATVIGAFADGELRGAAEIVAAGAGCAEAAFTVEPDYQAHGIGGVLIENVIDAARATGLRELLFEVLAGNGAMIGLIRRHGGRVVERGPMISFTIALMDADRSAA